MHQLAARAPPRTPLVDGFDVLLAAHGPAVIISRRSELQSHGLGQDATSASIVCTFGIVLILMAFFRGVTRRRVA